MKTGWDVWSRVYRLFEYSLLGRTLARARLAGVPDLSSPRRVLLLGDGDGRFLAHALTEWPEARFVSIDASAGMVAQSRARNEVNGRDRVEWIEGAVPTVLERLEESGFDVVCTVFFLDCFSESELKAWMPTAVEKLSPGGFWSVVDFTHPGILRGWRQMRQSSLLKILYLAFQTTTSISARALPDMEAPLRNSGLSLKTDSLLEGGLYRAQLWQKLDNESSAGSLKGR